LPSRKICVKPCLNNRATSPFIIVGI
jgi:hypothetical protein